MFAVSSGPHESRRVTAGASHTKADASQEPVHPVLHYVASKEELLRVILNVILLPPLGEDLQADLAAEDRLAILLRLLCYSFTTQKDLS